MFFEKGDRGELLVDFAGFAIDFDEALVLSQFLESKLTRLRSVENIAELAICHHLPFYRVVGSNFWSDDDDVFEGKLYERRSTLQMGHWLFLLMTRIL